MSSGVIDTQDWISGLVSARQALCQWATSPALTNVSCMTISVVGNFTIQAFICLSIYDSAHVSHCSHSLRALHQSPTVHISTSDIFPEYWKIIIHRRYLKYLSWALSEVSLAAGLQRGSVFRRGCSAAWIVSSCRLTVIYLYNHE